MRISFNSLMSPRRIVRKAGRYPISYPQVLTIREYTSGLFRGRVIVVIGDIAREIASAYGKSRGTGKEGTGISAKCHEIQVIARRKRHTGRTQRYSSSKRQRSQARNGVGGPWMASWKEENQSALYSALRRCYIDFERSKITQESLLLRKCSTMFIEPHVEPRGRVYDRCS
jgi:hypothetical protein